MTLCDKCGKEIGEEETITQVIPPYKDAQPIYLCEECAKKADEYFQTATEKPSVDLSYGKAILFGFVSALICSIIWYGCVVYTSLQFGFVAVGVGYIISLAVVEGSQTLNGHKLKWISAGCTLFSMAISQYLIGHYHYSLYLIGQGYPPPSIILSLGEIWYILSSDILNNPASIFFWLIAISEAYILPIRWRPG